MNPLPRTASPPTGTLLNLLLGVVMASVGAFLWFADGERALLGASCAAFFGLTVPVFAHQRYGAAPGLPGRLARFGLRAGPFWLLAFLALVAYSHEPRGGDTAIAGLVAASLLAVVALFPASAGLFSRSPRASLAREGLLLLGDGTATLVPWSAIRAVERARYWFVPAVEVGLTAEGFALRQYFAPRGASADRLTRCRHDEARRETAVRNVSGADVLVWSYRSALGVGDLYSELRAARERPELRRNWPTTRSLVRAHFGEAPPHKGAGPYRREGGDDDA